MDEKVLNEKLENQTISDDFGKNSSSDELKEEHVFKMVDEDFFKSFEDDFNYEESEENHSKKISDLPVVLADQAIESSKISTSPTEYSKNSEPPDDKKIKNNEEIDKTLKETLISLDAQKNEDVSEKSLDKNYETPHVQNTTTTEKNTTDDNLSTDQETQTSPQTDQKILFSEDTSTDEIDENEKNQESETDVMLKGWDISINSDEDLILRAIAESEKKQNLEKAPLLLKNKLLENFHLTGSYLKNEMIDAATLDEIVNQNIFQKILKFLFSAEIMRGILLLPFLSRNSIKINKSESPLIDDEITDNKKQKDSKKLELDGNDEGNPLIPSKENFDEQIEKPDKNCSSPIYTTSALLIKDEKTRKNVIGVTTYHDTAKLITGKLWDLFLFSLVIHGTINFYLYPDERNGATLLDTLGISSLADTFCIEEVQFLCFTQTKGYDQILLSALDQPFIWPLMLSLPIGFGIINAIQKCREVKSLETFEITELQNTLGNYKSSLWRDVGGWIVTAVIPDIFPVAILCCLDLLPIVEVKKTLEEVKDIIIWDGNISNDDRLALFRSLRKFTRENHKITQLYAISTIASIINDIELNNIEYLKTQGVDNEALKTLVYIKTECFRELRYLAKHYSLPHILNDEKSCYKPLIRYIFANYLMWISGHPQNHGFHLPFLIYNGLKLYSAVIFVKTIVNGIIELINRQIQKARCEAEGNLWKWMEYQQEYNCSVCGDLPVYFGSIFTIEDCFAAYLAVPRTLNDLLRFINTSNNPARFGFNLSKVKILDLSAQTIILQNATEFSLFLTQLKPKLSNVERVYLNGSFVDPPPMIGGFLIDFIQNTSVTVFACKGPPIMFCCFTAYTKLAYILPTLLLRYLDFSYSLAEQTYDFRFLKNSTIRSLILSGNPVRDVGLQTIIDLLPNLELRELTIKKIGLSPLLTTCINLAKKLPQSKIVYLDIGSNNLVDSCFEALANATTQLKHNVTLIIDTPDSMSGGYIGDKGMSAFAKALNTKPSILLKEIYFGSFFVSQDTLLEFIRSIANSSLTSLQLGSISGPNNNYNYSIVIPELANALHQSQVTKLGLSGVFGGMKAIQLLASFLPTHLQKLIDLDLQGCNLSDQESIQALAQVLNQTNIKFLNLQLTGFTNGLAYLADKLPETNIIDLDVSHNLLNLSEIDAFAKKLNRSKLQSFRCSWSGINNIGMGDDAALSVIQGLPGSELKTLELSFDYITNAGAKAIAQSLAADKVRHGLWIDYLIENIIGIHVKYLGLNTKLNLIDLDLSLNRLQDDSVEQLCKILPETKLSYLTFIQNIAAQVDSNNRPNFINTSILMDCGVFFSEGNSLRPPLPYLLLYRIYQGSKQFIEYYLLKYSYLKPANHNNEFLKTEEAQVETQKSNIFLDASSDTSNDLIMVNLNKDNLLEIHVGNKHLDIDEATIAFSGNVQSNHHLTGGDESLFDVSQNHGVNFIRSGINNWIRLGFWSTDHVVVTENQGTIKIQEFESKDTLHIVETYTVYPDDAKIVCIDEISENNLPMAVIQLKETTVQLINTHCEDIENNVRVNDDEALRKAQIEVMQTSSTLYANLLKLCETFLGSVEKASFITAVPRFVTELFYRLGSHTREQAEAFGQELQRDLMISFASSPYSLTAGCLATWIASRLSNSPRIISIATISATLTATSVETLLTQNISFGWMVLNTGVALMGSIIGNNVIDQLPRICTWGFRKTSEAKNYFGNKMHFWGTGRKNNKSSIDDVPTIEEIATESFHNYNSLNSMQF